MMMKTMRWILAMAISCVVGANARAATLNVGDRAPKLQVGKWIQGEAVTEFQKDKAYIVEFWATWCGPCRQSIPHLNEIANKFKDKGLVVIGQDVLEDDEDGVRKFVREMGDKMTYRVVLDDTKSVEKGAMATTWMDAAGQNGIPTAFLIAKTGEIAWIGHPMALEEKTIEEVLSGNFDAKKAAVAFARKREQEEKVESIWKEFQQAAAAKEWTKAEGLLAAMEKEMDEEDRANLDTVRLRLSLRKEDMAAAEKVALRLSEKEPEDAAYHDKLSWMLVTQPGISKSLLALAEKEAARANDLSKGKEPGILDTVARVQFVKGEKEAAIATQQKAIDLAEGKEKAHYQKTLEAYKAGELPE